MIVYVVQQVYNLRLVWAICTSKERAEHIAKVLRATRKELISIHERTLDEEQPE